MIKSKCPSREYDEGWERVFGKKAPDRDHLAPATRQACESLDSERRLLQAKQCDECEGECECDTCPSDEA